MSKNKIRITENELKQIVAESVKKVLNENWEDDYNAAMDKADYQTAKKEYDSKNIFGKLFAMVSGNKPVDKNPQKTLEDLLNQYVIAFNQEHGIGKRADYANGEAFHSKMVYSGDKSNLNQPIISATYTRPGGNSVEQSRRAFNSDGSSEEWGIGYPYSEIGRTLKGRPDSKNQYVQKGYDDFLRHRDEIGNVIKRRNSRKK
jgi:hypothetical protein